MEIMYYTVYKTTNLINNKFYIGKHQTKNLNDGYLGSGKAFQSALKKYGKENFKKEILFIFDKEIDMNVKEQELVTEEIINNTDCYNAAIGGEGGPHFKNRKHSPETILKLKNYASKRVFSEETRKKISEANRNRKGMKQNRKKGVKPSLETKIKISNSMKLMHQKTKLLRGREVASRLPHK